MGVGAARPESPPLPSPPAAPVVFAMPAAQLDCAAGRRVIYHIFDEHGETLSREERAFGENVAPDFPGARLPPRLALDCAGARELLMWFVHVSGTPTLGVRLPYDTSIHAASSAFGAETVADAVAVDVSLQQRSVPQLFYALVHTEQGMLDWTPGVFDRAGESAELALRNSTVEATGDASAPLRAALDPGRAPYTIADVRFVREFQPAHYLLVPRPESGQRITVATSREAAELVGAALGETLEYSGPTAPRVWIKESVVHARASFPAPARWQSVGALPPDRDVAPRLRAEGVTGELQYVAVVDAG
jgi:hypothetical protein